MLAEQNAAAVNSKNFFLVGGFWEASMQTLIFLLKMKITIGQFDDTIPWSQEAREGVQPVLSI